MGGVGWVGHPTPLPSVPHLAAPGLCCRFVTILYLISPPGVSSPMRPLLSHLFTTSPQPYGPSVPLRPMLYSPGLAHALHFDLTIAAPPSRCYPCMTDPFLCGRSAPLRFRPVPSLPVLSVPSLTGPLPAFLCGRCRTVLASPCLSRPFLASAALAIRSRSNPSFTLLARPIHCGRSFTVQ